MLFRSVLLPLSLSACSENPSYTTVKPSVKNFGNQPVASTKLNSQLFILTNARSDVQGNNKVNVSSIKLTGAGASSFLILNDDCIKASLAQGSSCILNVNFAPTSPGTKLAKIIISDNAAISPQTIELLGNGVAAH